MNIRSRNCGNCAAFNATPEADEPSCGDLVSFTERANTATELRRAPMASDLCSGHLTHLEDELENQIIEEQFEQGGTEQAIQAASSIFIARSVIRRAMR